MKAHFKRSMKEYEAKLLNDSNNEKQHKLKRGFEYLTEHNNMPNPNNDQETQIDLATSPTNTMLMNSTRKDAKTPTKRSAHPFHKQLHRNNSTFELSSAKYPPMDSSNECGNVSIKQDCDIDMEDNNNKLVIDEGDSIDDKHDIVSSFESDETDQSLCGVNSINIINNEDTLAEGNEEDIVVDDDVDEQDRYQGLLSRRGLDQEHGASLTLPSQALTTATYTFNNAVSRTRALEDMTIDIGDAADDGSENEDENLSVTKERIENETSCDDLVEEERKRKCNWCQRPGPCSIIMQVSESLEEGEERMKHIKHKHHHSSQKQKKAFCCERCFSLYRRAAFKKNRRCEWCRRPSKQPLPVKDDKHRQFCR